MLFFGHIGITLGIFFGLQIFIPRLRTIIDPKYLIIGALLPDLIDKPIGMIIFASTFANGRIIAHTLLFFLSLLVVGLYIYKKKKDIRVLTLASGSFLHLMEDQMWASPITLFWPLLGWSFPKDNIADGITFLLMLFKESFAFHFSLSSVPEILGMGVIVVLTLHWLIKELRQNRILTIKKALKLKTEKKL
ncbi:MAG TPA: metal-dependent hydrolase [Methanosarcina sp.]|jgi:hypothetical protein